MSKTLITHDLVDVNAITKIPLIQSGALTVQSTASFIGFFPSSACSTSEGHASWTPDPEPLFEMHIDAGS